MRYLSVLLLLVCTLTGWSVRDKWVDRNTAKTFYAAGTFFDILNQFGEISGDVRAVLLCPLTAGRVWYGR